MEGDEGRSGLPNYGLQVSFSTTPHHHHHHHHHIHHEMGFVQFEDHNQAVMSFLTPLSSSSQPLDGGSSSSNAASTTAAAATVKTTAATASLGFNHSDPPQLANRPSWNNDHQVIRFQYILVLNLSCIHNLTLTLCRFFFDCS